MYLNIAVEDLSSASEGSEHESDEDDTDALSANTCFDCGATSMFLLVLIVRFHESDFSVTLVVML